MLRGGSAHDYADRLVRLREAVGGDVGAGAPGGVGGGDGVGVGGETPLVFEVFVLDEGEAGGEAVLRG